MLLYFNQKSMKYWKKKTVFQLTINCVILVDENHFVLLSYLIILVILSIVIKLYVRNESASHYF